MANLLSGTGNAIGQGIGAFTQANTVAWPQTAPVFDYPDRRRLARLSKLAENTDEELAELAGSIAKHAGMLEDDALKVLRVLKTLLVIDDAIAKLAGEQKPANSPWINPQSYPLAAGLPPIPQQMQQTRP